MEETIKQRYAERRRLLREARTPLDLVRVAFLLDYQIHWAESNWIFREQTRRIHAFEAHQAFYLYLAEHLQRCLALPEAINDVSP